MKIVELKTSELIPYAKNPRDNAKAVKYVANSIKEFGFKNPVIIDKNNVIVCGHTRLLAAQQLGLEKIPCIMADDLTDEQIRAFRLADNKVAEIAEWDSELLSFELEEIELDMSEFGFELDAGGVEEEKEVNDLSDSVEDTYQVIVECLNELDQERTYNALIGEGFTCRVLTL